MTIVLRNHRNTRTKMLLFTALVLFVDVTSSAQAWKSLLEICNHNQMTYEEINTKLYCSNLDKTEDFCYISGACELYSFNDSYVRSCSHLPKTYRSTKNANTVSFGTIQHRSEIKHSVVSFLNVLKENDFSQSCKWIILQLKNKCNVIKESEFRGDSFEVGLSRCIFAGNIFIFNVQTTKFLCKVRRHILSHCKISKHSANNLLKTGYAYFDEQAMIAFNWVHHLYIMKTPSYLLFRTVTKSGCLSILAQGNKTICDINSKCLYCSNILNFTTLAANVQRSVFLFKVFYKFQNLSLNFIFEDIDGCKNFSDFLRFSRLVNQCYNLSVEKYKSLNSNITSMSVRNSQVTFFNILEIRKYFAAILCLLLMSFKRHSKPDFLQEDKIRIQYIKVNFDIFSVLVSWLRREHCAYKRYTFNLSRKYFSNGFNHKNFPKENVEFRYNDCWHHPGFKCSYYDSPFNVVTSLLGGITCYDFNDKYFASNNKDLVKNCYRRSYLLSLGDTHERLPFHLYPVYKSTLDKHFESSLNDPSTDTSLGFELIRVGTFSSFSGSNAPSSLTLARAGFFFTGEADTVECFHCHARHTNWNTKDDPFVVHRRISPTCGFINGQINLNVPVVRYGDSTEVNSGQTMLQPQHGTRTTSGSDHMHVATVSDSAVRNTPGGTHLPCVNSSSTDMQHHHNEIQSENHYQQNLNRTTPHNRFNISSQHPTFMQNGSTHPGSELGNSALTNFRASDTAIANSKSPVNYTQQNHQQRTNAQRIRHHASQQNYQVNSPLDIGPEQPFNGVSTSECGSLKLEPLGIVSVSPRYPAYAVLSVRMSTFQGWPPTSGQTPKQMATAGFIFAGYSDYTRCFFCGGGLRNWEPEDDPWIEHAKWFPKCVYLRQNKGDSFVLLVHQSLINPSILEASQRHETNSEHRTEENVVLPALDPTSNSTTVSSNTAAIQSVQEMGYSRQIIDSAIITLCNDGKEVDAYNIMDVILANDLANSSISSTSQNHFTSLEAEPVCETEKAELQAIGHGIDLTSSQLQELNLSDIKSLVEENKSLKESRLCKVCLENEASIAFVPCGHLVCCGECAFALRKCPICRKFIEGRVKTWMA